MQLLSINCCRVIALAALLLPCAANALVAGAPPDTPAARVDANTASSPWRGVVCVTRNGEIYSGVAIGRRHVLTAGHVVDRTQPPSVHQVHFNFSGSAASVDVNVGVVAVTVHPSYGGVGVNDLALLQLTSDVPSQAAIYPLAAAAPALGSTFTLVGYGDSGNGTTGLTVSRSTTVKRVGTNAFDYSPDNIVYYFDFDGPTAATNYLGGPTLGNSTETTVGGGDSGGPAFVRIGSTWTLVGINAFRASVNGGPTTPGAFGTLGGGVFVAPFREWIDATLAASGVEGNDADVPLPLWACFVLGALLLRAAAAHRSRTVSTADT